MSKTQQINTLQRLTVGQPTTIKASTWNDFANHCESSNNDDLPPVKANDNSTVIICKNSTNADIPAFTMVSLETPVLPDGYNGLGKLYNATMTLSAIPTEEDVIGVTQELVEAGASGYVLISGITPLQLGSSPSDHPYASPDGTGGFTFHDDYGTARILHVIGTNALVLIGASPSAGGEAVDNTPDIFKAKNNTTTSKIDVSGGRVINGNANISCSGVSLNYPANNNLFYVVLTVAYSNNSYSASIGTSTSEIYPVALTATYTLMLAKVENVSGEIIITNLRYPSPVYVNGRWG